MRRIIHNTTALAACLSLLAPHLAMAQSALPDAAAPKGADLVLAQAETAPEDQVPPPAEDAAEDAPVAEEAPAEDGAAPAAEPAAEEAPAESAEPVPEAEAAPEPAAEPEAAPEPAAEAAPEPAAEAAPEAEAAAPAAEEAPAAEDAPAEAPAAEDAPAPSEPRPEPNPAPAPEAAPAPRPEAVDTPAPEANPNPDRPSDTRPSPAPDAPPSAAETEAAQPDAPPARNPQRQQPPADAPADAPGDTRPVPADRSEAPEPDAESQLNDLVEALGGDTDAEAPGEVETTPAAADASPAAGFTLGTGQVQTERARQLPGLAAVLDREVSAGLDPSSLTCLSGGSAPCADDGRAMTPEGVVVEPIGQGAWRLAPTEAQMFRVQDGQMVRRAAEEDTRETEASREAAEASTPSTAAALDAEEGSGEVTETQVTEESARSSSDDFATNLRDALAGATGQQPEAREEEDDDNTLRNALLLGLGAVAVGTYLNNNRQVALSAPDRVVVTRADGSQEVIKDEVALLRQPGSTVATENFDDGSSRTIVTREDGSRVVTIRDANLQVLRRTLVSADGTTTQLIDDTADVQPVDIGRLPAPAPVQTGTAPLNEDELRAALQRESNIERRFTLSQIRNIPEVRALVAPVNIDAITFDTGSAAIRPDQAQALQGLGRVIQDQIAQNPREIFMIEGHTDTVGSDAANLALSDRRAETVALALAEYFDVPPENLVTQGYGEQFLRIRSEGDIRENRRASVRRITELLAQQ